MLGNETLEQRRRRERTANGEYPYYMDEYHAFSELFRMLMEIFANYLSSLFGFTQNDDAEKVNAEPQTAAPQANANAAPVPTRFPTTAAPTVTVTNTLPVVDTAVTPGFTPRKPSF